MKSILLSYVDGWRTFVTNSEEIHNNFSKLNCRSHVAENCIVANDTWVEASNDSSWLFAGV